MSTFSRLASKSIAQIYPSIVSSSSQDNVHDKHNVSQWLGNQTKCLKTKVYHLSVPEITQLTKQNNGFILYQSNAPTLSLNDISNNFYNSEAIKTTYKKQTKNGNTYYYHDDEQRTTVKDALKDLFKHNNDANAVNHADILQPMINNPTHRNQQEAAIKLLNRLIDGYDDAYESTVYVRNGSLLANVNPHKANKFLHTINNYGYLPYLEKTEEKYQWNVNASQMNGFVGGSFIMSEAGVCAPLHIENICAGSTNHVINVDFASIGWKFWAYYDYGCCDDITKVLHSFYNGYHQETGSRSELCSLAHTHKTSIRTAAKIFDKFGYKTNYCWQRSGNVVTVDQGIYHDVYNASATLADTSNYMCMNMDAINTSFSYLDAIGSEVCQYCREKSIDYVFIDENKHKKIFDHLKTQNLAKNLHDEKKHGGVLKINYFYW